MLDPVQAVELGRRERHLGMSSSLEEVAVATRRRAGQRTGASRDQPGEVEKTKTRHARWGVPCVLATSSESPGAAVAPDVSLTCAPRSNSTPRRLSSDVGVDEERAGFHSSTVLKGTGWRSTLSRLEHRESSTEAVGG